MPKHELNEVLQELVRRHGISSVLHGLADIQTPRNQSNSSSPPARSRSARSKLSAVDYVGKMGLSQDKVEVMMRAAQRFEDRKFLPRVADVREFCRIYGVDLGKSVSRASSIPRIFKFLATMDTACVSRVLDSGLFSGPARVAPIADAIRNRTARHFPSDCPDNDRSVSDKVAEDYPKDR